MSNQTEHRQIEEPLVLPVSLSRTPTVEKNIVDADILAPLSWRAEPGVAS